MKNLITTMACLLIIFALILQVTANQSVHTKIMSINRSVNTFKEVARQEGFLSLENQTNLIAGIRSKLGDDVEVLVEGSKNPVERGFPIYYKVSVPIKGVYGAPGFWNISESENVRIYEIESTTTSEYIGRDKN